MRKVSPSTVWAGLNMIQYFLNYWVACSIGIRPFANTTLHKLYAVRFRDVALSPIL